MRNNTAAQPAIARTPSAARGAWVGLITNGSNTIEVASAIAIWGVTESTGGPVSFSESITGSASAADDDAISTAYSGAWPVSNTCANTTPSTAATAPTATALSKAFGIADRRVLSRTGTWVPTTNITNAKPILASSVKVASVWSTIPKPVLPTTRPAASSPMIAGTRKRGSEASSGPAIPMTASSASVWKPNPDISGLLPGHQMTRDVGVFVSEVGRAYA